MADLTLEGEKFLVDYCMESKNTWLALAIGQIQPALKRAIVRSFLEELEEAIAAELKRVSIDSRWKPRIRDEDGYMIVVLAMEDWTELLLVYQAREEDLFIGVRSTSDACPAADRLKPYFRDEDLEFKTDDPDWHWWFSPAKDHRSLSDLITLCDEQSKSEKIEYLAHIMADSANALSKELDSQELEQ